jgi:hypothetical protein
MFVHSCSVDCAITPCGGRLVHMPCTAVQLISNATITSFLHLRLHIEDNIVIVCRCIMVSCLHPESPTAIYITKSKQLCSLSEIRNNIMQILLIKCKYDPEHGHYIKCDLAHVQIGEDQQFNGTSMSLVAISCDMQICLFFRF